MTDSVTVCGDFSIFIVEAKDNEWRSSWTWSALWVWDIAFL